MHTQILAGVLNVLPVLLVPMLVMLLVLVTIWDAVWKLIALWKSGRNNQLAWFICLAIFNTAGILPILYILFFQKKPAAT